MALCAKRGEIMIQTLPMLAATLAMAGAPAPNSPTAKALFQLRQPVAACDSGFDDQGFVIRMPKTPAYDARGLLRLVRADGGSIQADGAKSCVIKAIDRR
jgi:hypothetical protein